MDGYTELFRIVPKGNGYLYLCVDKTGNQHYLTHKTKRDNGELLFETADLAQQYIDKNLKMSDTMQLYVPEFILYRNDYIHSYIINEVK